jgi:hypothetical protein
MWRCGANLALCCHLFALVPRSRIFSTLKVEAIRSSETLVHTRSTGRHIPEDGILQLSVGLQVLSSNFGDESKDGQTEFPRRILRNERIEPITMLGISTATHLLTSLRS